MNHVTVTAPWPSAPDHVTLAEHEVHVWTAPLDLARDALDQFSGILSSDEKERAERFKFERHRNRFIAGRGCLRAILARYVQTEAARLDFVYSPKGKPSLSPRFDPARIHFNLAHSEDLALVAVTQVGPVGIDLEQIRPVKDAEELVARFFSPRENALFQKLPSSQKAIAFFNLWTRKEALLKATGEGIGQSLGEVEVSFLPGEPARLLGIGGDSEKAAVWSVHELASADGFTAALAIQSRTIRIRRYR